MMYFLLGYSAFAWLWTFSVLIGDKHSSWSFKVYWTLVSPLMMTLEIFKNLFASRS